MQRRRFIQLAGGGVVAGAGLAGCALQDFPAEALEAWQGPGAETDARRRAVAYAITAPNPHNLQPWLVDLRAPGELTLYCDRGRLLPETDPFGRQILIGHGAFLELLVLALAEQGLHSELTLWPQGAQPAALADWDQRPVARIRLQPGGTPDPLFAQVLQRHTPKVDFDTARSVPAARVQQMVESVRGTRVQAGATVDIARVQPLRTLCREAAQVEIATPRTAMESLRLVRVGPEEIRKHRDGISVNGLVPRTAAAFGLLDLERPPEAGSAAYREMMRRFEGHSASAMGFVWLATADNQRSTQIETGRAYLRLQLMATALGIGMHPMSQALQEFPQMAPHYATAHRLLLGKSAPRTADDATVQMLCRIGYPKDEVLPSPRRPLAQFLST